MRFKVSKTRDEYSLHRAGPIESVRCRQYGEIKRLVLKFGGFHYENPVQSILDFEKFESCPKAVAIVCQPSFP